MYSEVQQKWKKVHLDGTKLEDMLLVSKNYLDFEMPLLWNTAVKLQFCFSCLCSSGSLWRCAGRGSLSAGMLAVLGLVVKLLV